MAVADTDNRTAAAAVDVDLMCVARRRRLEVWKVVETKIKPQSVTTLGKVPHWCSDHRSNLKTSVQQKTMSNTENRFFEDIENRQIPEKQFLLFGGCVSMISLELRAPQWRHRTPRSKQRKYMVKLFLHVFFSKSIRLKSWPVWGAILSVDITKQIGEESELSSLALITSTERQCTVLLNCHYFTGKRIVHAW